MNKNNNIILERVNISKEITLDLSYWTILLISFILQGTLVSWTFPLHELFSDNPLFYIDGAMHWFRITAAQNLAQAGNLIGIDPFFGSGVPVGIAMNPAAKVPTIMAIVLGLKAVLAWKLYAFGCALLGPICVPLSARILHLGRSTVLISSGLGILIWWVSMFRWFHTAGLVSFVFAAFLGLPYLAALYRYAEGEGGFWTVIGLGGIGAAGLYIHPLFPIPIIVGSLILFAMHPRILAQRHALNLILVIPLLAIIPSIPWIYPTFFLSFITEPSGITHQALVDPSMIWMELLGIWKGNAHGANLYPFIALGAAWAVFASQPGRVRQIIWVFTALGIFLALYAALAAIVPMLALWTQPNRFSPVAYLYLTIPCSIGISTMIGCLHEKRRPLVQMASVAPVLLAFGLGIVYGVRELIQETSYTDGPHYGEPPPEVKPLGGYTRFILSWLAQNTSPDARILFETSNARIYDGSQIAGYLAYNSEREFIGGPYPFQHFAGFWDGVLFRKPIREMTADKFRRYADLYNIGSVIVFSKASIHFFDTLDFAHLSGEYEHLRAYKLDRSPSYIIGGIGTIVARTHNKIQLAGLEGSAVILKYHFLPGLRSDPPTPMEPIYLEDDPNPFIRLPSPPQRLMLYLPWPSRVIEVNHHEKTSILHH